MKSLTLGEFIKKANEKHNFKYDYTHSVYVNSQTKIKVICDNNHEFLVRPDMHLNRGDGCRKCKNLKMVKSNDSFIEELRLVFDGFDFDFQEVQYSGVYNKVKIICRKHGEFQKSPNFLLKGVGCPECNTYNKMDRDKFIERANILYNNKFIYDENFEYSNSRSKVKILCPKHGYFHQLANNHLQGHSCNKCNNRSKSEIIIENLLSSKSLNFETEFKFKDLRFRYPLRFDFVIFNLDSSIRFLLEFNGRQHYEMVRAFHENDMGFEVYKQRDFLKKEYCNKNNIPLHIIKYDEDINESLTKILNQYENKQNS